MTIRTTAIATVALLALQAGAAEASLPAADAGAMPGTTAAAVAGPALTSDGLAAPALDDADTGASARLAFGVRVPGLKHVGRALGAITGGNPSAPSEQVRDHRTRTETQAPRVRDHRGQRATVRHRSRTRVPARRGSDAPVIRDHRAERAQELGSER